MDQNVRSALKSQYRAGFATLRQAVECCPADLWLKADSGMPPCWWIAYHALFCTHHYLQPNTASFRPWTKHRDNAQFSPEAAGQPFTRDEVLEYLGMCEEMVGPCVDALDLTAPDCGFPWYSMPKLDHQILNIRHLQHHAAHLDAILRMSGCEALDWQA
jgi:hypothetical protein